MNLNIFFRPIFLLVLPLSLTACAFGIVRDSRTGAPIPSAQVIFHDSQGGTGTVVANEKGVYVFDPSLGNPEPEKGMVTFEVSAPGYLTTNQNRFVDYGSNPAGTWEAQNFQLLPATTPCGPEVLHLSEIGVKLGGYGAMHLSDIQDDDTFTMTVGEAFDSQHWASVGVDLLDFDDWGKKPGRDLSCYKYVVVRARGAVGGEQFRIGLGIGPVDYLYDQGLTAQWQDLAFDMGQIWTLERRSNVYQFGFEIGPDWTDNTTGTNIYIDGVWFTNQLDASP